MKRFRKVILSFACFILSLVSIHAQRFPCLEKDVFQHDSVVAKHMKVIKDYRNLYDTHPKKDINGNDCVLLRVITLNDSCISFSGNIVGDVKYKDLAYWVYMSGSSHLLQINEGDKILNLDLSCMNKDNPLQGGESYSLCGLDNDDFVSLDYHIDYNTEDAKKLRAFAHEYIDAFNNGDMILFRSYYDSDKRLFEGNREALYRLIAELENNENIGYYAKCFPIYSHMATRHIYGMTVSFYNLNSEIIGYSFLLLDLNDPNIIQNHISTYQTNQDVEKNGVFTLYDFFIP